MALTYTKLHSTFSPAVGMTQLLPERLQVSFSQGNVPKLQYLLGYVCQVSNAKLFTYLGLQMQAILAVDASGWLNMAGPCARTPERNVETVAAFNLGSPGTRILSGQLCT